LRFNALRWPLLLLVSIAAVPGADNGKPEYTPRAVTEYPHRQTSENVTIAAQAFETDEETKEPFGKVNPWRYGILPVLLVMQNSGKDAIRLDRIKVIYTLPDRSKVEATPAQDLKYLRGAKRPGTVPGPAIPGISRAPKNPLAEWEIEGRAFAAKMLPAGQTASGFVYFQVPQSSAAASVYISGLTNAVTGNELYYFEISMSGK
jgi:hypothetical protein